MGTQRAQEYSTHWTTTNYPPIDCKLPSYRPMYISNRCDTNITPLHHFYCIKLKQFSGKLHVVFLVHFLVVVKTPFCFPLVLLLRAFSATTWIKVEPHYIELQGPLLSAKVSYIRIYLADWKFPGNNQSRCRYLNRYFLLALMLVLRLSIAADSYHLPHNKAFFTQLVLNLSVQKISDFIVSIHFPYFSMHLWLNFGEGKRVLCSLLTQLHELR